MKKIRENPIEERDKVRNFKAHLLTWLIIFAMLLSPFIAPIFTIGQLVAEEAPSSLVVDNQETPQQTNPIDLPIDDLSPALSDESTQDNNTTDTNDESAVDQTPQETNDQDTDNQETDNQASTQEDNNIDQPQPDTTEDSDENLIQSLPSQPDTVTAVNPAAGIMAAAVTTCSANSYSQLANCVSSNAGNTVTITFTQSFTTPSGTGGFSGLLVTTNNYPAINIPANTTVILNSPAGQNFTFSQISYGASGSNQQNRHFNIANTGALTLNNVTLDGGQASDGPGMAGGIIVNQGGYLTLNAGAVISNIYGATGGNGANGIAIMNSGTVYMNNGTISAGRSPNSQSAGVYNSSTGEFNLWGGSIQNFNSNSTNSGIWNAGGKLNFTGGTIQSNKSANGGAIYNTGTASISGTARITGNNASSNGGGIYNTGTVTLGGGNITQNTAALGGGIYNTGTFTFTNGNISNNTAAQGGGIWNNSTNFTMSGGIVSSNTATPTNSSTATNYGGGVYTTSSSGSNVSFAMSGGTITGNTVSNTSGAGGWPAGGGVAVLTSTFNFTGGTISNNSVTTVATGRPASGGGIYGHGDATINMSGGSVSGNSSAQIGGGIVSRNVLNISGGTITGNSSQYGAGVALSNANDTTNLTSTASPTGNLTFTGGSITNNKYTGTSASMGGGIFAISGSKVTMNNNNGTALIDSNTATQGGGIAIYSTSGNMLYVTAGTISNNTATGTGTTTTSGGSGGGGGIWLNPTNNVSGFNSSSYGVVQQISSSVIFQGNSADVAVQPPSGNPNTRFQSASVSIGNYTSGSNSLIINNFDVNIYGPSMALNLTFNPGVFPGTSNAANAASGNLPAIANWSSTPVSQNLGTTINLPTGVNTNSQNPRYIFAGWIISDPSGNAPSSTPVMTLPATVTNSQTFTATWALLEYTVTLDPNGGVLPTNITGLNVPNSPFTPNSNPGTVMVANTDTVNNSLGREMIAGNTTEDNLNDSDANLIYQGVSASIVPTDTVPLPNNTSHPNIFKGWSTTPPVLVCLSGTLSSDYTICNGANAGEDSPLMQPSGNGTIWDEDTEVTSDITVYALWYYPLFVVHFNSNGGNPAPDQTARVYNYYVIQPPTTPHKTGFVFAGWFSDINDANNATSSTTTNPGQFVFGTQGTPVIQTTTLYAGWIQTSFNFITFNRGTYPPVPYGCQVSGQASILNADPEKCGTFPNYAPGQPNIVNAPVKYGTTYWSNTAGSAPTIAWAGYTFLGWNTAFDGSGNYITDTTLVGNEVILTDSHNNPVLLDGNNQPVYTDSLGNPILDASGNLQVVGPAILDSSGNLIIANFNDIPNQVNNPTNNPLSPSTVPQVADSDGNLTPNTQTYQTSNQILTTYPDGTPILDANGNRQYTSGYRLYAIWQPNQYTVTFDANGGENPPHSITVTTSYTYDDTIVMPSPFLAGNVNPVSGNFPAQIPTRFGYNFLGWSFMPNAKSSSVVLAANGNTGTVPVVDGAFVTGDTVVTNIQNQTLYAIWSLMTLNVNFSPGGSNVSGMPDTIQVTFNSSFDTKTDGTSGNFPTVNPTRPGYTFTGWTMPNPDNSPDANPQPVSVDGSTIVSSYDASTGTPLINLTAQWQPNDLTVTFNTTASTNGASASAPTPATTTVTFGDVYGTLPTATNPGFTLSSWNTSADGSGFTITPESIVGSSAPVCPSGFTLSTDQTTCTSTTDPDTTQTPSDMVLSDLTLYAQWTANTITVTFNPNGTSVDGDGYDEFTNDATVSPTTSDVVFGQAYSTGTDLTNNALPTPTLTSYTFVGWFDTSATTGGNQITSSTTLSASQLDANGNVTLYARWAPIQYTVYFVATDAVSGATISVTPNNPETVRYGNTISQPEVPNTTDSGQSNVNVDFVGWTTNKNAVAHDNGDGTYSMVDPTNDNATVSPFDFANTPLNASNTHAATPTSASLSIFAVWSTEQWTVAFLPNQVDVNGNKLVGTVMGQDTNGDPSPTDDLAVIPGIPSQVANQSNTWTITVPSIPPTLTGYTFLGWSTNRAATQASMQSLTTDNPAGDKFDFTQGITDQTSLAAIWLPNAHTLTYNANKPSSDSTSVTGTMASQPINVGQTVTLTNNAFTLVGYTFNGWNTSADGSGTSYNNADTFTLSSDSDVSLYAQWTANTYPISFNTNGGTPTSVPTINLAFDSLYSSGAWPSDPTRTGYVFAGWQATNATTTTNDTTSPLIIGGTNGVAPNSVRVTFAGSDTFTAMWTPQNFNITFNYNTVDALGNALIGNVTGTTGTNNQQSVGYGVATPLTSNGFDITNYDFVGWSTTSTGSVAYTNNANFTLNQADDNTVLYAVWQPATFTITFDKDGGSASDSGTDNIQATVTFGDTYGHMTITSPENATLPTDLTKQGYTFIGWTSSTSTSNITNTTTSALQASRVTFGGNDTFTAVYSPNDYHIVFNQNQPSNASTSVSGTMSNQDITMSTSVTLTTNAFALTGYTFNGWNTRANGSGVTYTNGSSLALNSDNFTTLPVDSNGNIQLYAMWSPVTYQIAFNANKPSSASTSLSGSMDNQPIVFDATSPTTLTPVAYSLIGYTFQGWSTSSTGSTATLATGTNNTLNNTLSLNTTSLGNLSVDNTTTPPTINLYGVWLANQHTVSFNVNSVDINNNALVGTPSTPNPTSINVTFDQAYGTLPTTSLAGYTFNGWYDASNNLVTNESKFILDSNQQLFARWTPNQVTVNFNSNGGVLGQDAPTSTTINFNSAYGSGSATTLPTNLTRAGYVFKGWSTVQDDTLTNNLPTNQVTETSILNDASTVDWSTNNGTTTGTKTLYATWSTQTYTVRFDTTSSTLDTNGNTLINTPSSAPADMSVTYDSPYGALPTATRTGYSFAGWFTTPQTDTSAGTQITNTTNVGDLSTNNPQTLYARWTPNSHLINFDGNVNNAPNISNTTNPSVGNIPNSIQANFNASTALPTSIPTLSGYTFLGWSDTPTGSATYLTGTNNTTNLNYVLSVDNDVTLYAIWQPTLYRVTFNNNDGTNTTTSIQVPFNSAYNSQSAPNAWPSNPTRATYTFNGWFTQASGGTQVNPTDINTEASNKTLYAQWSEVYYTVNFNTQGGSTISPVSVRANTTVSQPADPTPIDSNYTFQGWQDASTGNTFDFSTPINADTTLNAVWSGELFSIVFNANGGSPNPGSIALNSTNDWGAGPTNPSVKPTNPTRLGYTFVDWYLASDVTNGLPNVGASAWNGWGVHQSTDISLIAVWQGNTYTITFHSNETNAPNNNLSTSPNNNEVSTGTMSAQDIVFGTSENLNANAFGLTGYTFAGWSTSATGNVVFNDQASFSLSNPDNVDLFAVWTPKSNIPVTFDVSNMSGVSTPNPISVTFNSTYGTLPNVTTQSDLQVSGYTFNGWFTQASGGTQVLSSSQVTSTSAQTLYAQWTSNNFTVTLDVNGGNALTDTSLNVTFNSTYAQATNTSNNVVGLPTAPTRNGYSFAGWLDNSNNLITNASTVTITNDATFTASWIPNTYTLQFNLNPTDTDGRALSNSPQDVSPTSRPINFDSVYGTLPTTLAAGYTFNGWFTSPTGGTQVSSTTVFAPNPAPANNSNVTLYAQWTKQADIPLTFDLNGGTLSTGGTSISSQSIVYNTPATNPNVVLVKPGFSFAGWALSALDSTNASTPLPSGLNGSAPYDFSQRIINPSPIASYVLTAQWTSKSNLDVTFNFGVQANGSNVVDTTSQLASPNNTNPQSVQYDGNVVLPPTPSNPGFVFVGWTTANPVVWNTQNPSNNSPVFSPGTPIEDNTILYAIWQGQDGTNTISSANELTWTVSFNNNLAINQTLSSSAIGNQSVANSNIATRPTNPTSPGYSFISWNTSADGSGTTYTFNTPVTSNITLYAQWQQMANVNVVFNPNSISPSVASFPSNMTLDSNGNYVVSIAYDSPVNNLTLAQEPNQPGYKFIGWSTRQQAPLASDATIDQQRSAADYDFTSNVIDPTLTLYAVWQSQASLSVTFDINGGTFTTSPSTSIYPNQTIAYSALATNPAQGNTPIKIGYIFGGWSSDASNTAYNFSNPVTSNLTLTAIWQASATNLTVNFDANGNNVTNMPASQTVAYSDTIAPNSTTTIPTNTPIRPGFAFTGWNNGSSVWNVSSPVQSDMTLTAQWTPMSNVTVNFNASNPNVTSQPSNPPSQTPQYNATATSPANNPVVLGFEFLGWTTDTNPTSTSTIFNFSTPINSSTVNIVNSATTLNAIYVAQNPVSITFNVDGGTPVPDNKTNLPYNTVTSAPSLPVRPGYTFGGWFNASDVTRDASNSYYVANANTSAINWSTPLSNDLNLVAVWQPATQGPFNATFTDVSDDASVTNMPGTQENILYNGTVSSVANPDRPGYIFKYWTTDSNPTTSSPQYVFSTLVTDDVPLYAVWQSMESLDVTFELNVGSFPTSGTSVPNTSINGSTLSATYYSEVAYNSIITQPENPVYSGFKFGGWFSDVALTTPFNFTNTNITEDTTIYARWIGADGTTSGNQITYHVVFNPNTSPWNLNTTSPAINQDVAYGSSASAPTPNPIRVGYSFGGWSLQSSGTQTLFDVNNTPLTDQSTGITIADNTDYTVNLYAIWNPQGQVTVSFDLNHASSPTSAPDSQELDFNATATQPSNPILEGYRFAGWFMTSPNQATSAWNFGQPVSQTMTLTAGWSDANGNIFVGNTTYDSTSNTFSGNAITPDGSTISNATSQVITKTVTFNLLGGQGTFTSPVTVDFNAYASKPSPDPIKAGYQFGGWSTDASPQANTNIFSFDTTRINDSNTTSNNLNLYAVWIGADGTTSTTSTTTNTDGTTNTTNALMVDITYNYNDGSTPSKVVSIPLNSAIGSAPTPNPTRTGYNFVGWSTNQTNNVPFTNWTGPQANNLTLFAIWTPVTFGFNSDGTVNSSGSGATFGQALGNALPSAPNAPTEGQVFGGWQVSNLSNPNYVSNQPPIGNNLPYLDLNGNPTASQYSPVSSDTPVSQAILQNGLTPIWNTQTFTVTFVNLGLADTAYTGTIAGNPFTVNYGDTVSIPDAPTTDSPATSFESGGQTYTFFGWFEQSNATYRTTLNDFFIGSTDNPATPFDFTNTNITEDTYIYGVWNPPAYFATFYANTGNATSDEAVSNLPGNELLRAGNNWSPTQPSDTPTRIGYTFNGWYVDSSLDTPADTTNVWGVEQTGNVDLYASWTPNSVSVTLDGNPPSSNFTVQGITTSPFTVNFDTTYGSNLVKPTFNGYNFLGWSTSNNPTISANADGSSSISNQVSQGMTVSNTDPTSIAWSNGSGTQTLYAIWQQQGQITVTYVGNGGTPSTVITQNVLVGSNYTIPDSSNNPIRPGFSFKEWNTSADGSGTTVTNSTMVSISTSHNVYAIWIDANNNIVDTSGNIVGGDNAGNPATPINVNVTFNGNGGTPTSSVVPILYNNPASPLNPAPIYPGFSFVGWTTDTTVTSTSSIYPFTDRITSPITLTAIWQDKDDNYITSSNPADTSVDASGNPTNTNNAIYIPVLFNLNEGSFNGTPSHLDANNIERVLLNGNATVTSSPIRVGYSFNGWYLNTSDSSSFNFNETLINTSLYNYTSTSAIGSYPIGSRFVQLTARWTVNNQTFNVVYNLNDNTAYPASPSTITDSNSYKYEATVQMTNVTPTRPGFNFVGWTSDPTVTASSVAFNSSTLLNEQTTVMNTANTVGTLTLTAMWSDASGKLITTQNPASATNAIYVPVNFVANDSTAYPATNMPTNITAASQQVLINSTYTGPSSSPSRNGFIFGGWYLDSTLTNKFTGSYQITSSSGVTLYAAWLGGTYDSEGNLVVDSNGNPVVAKDSNGNPILKPSDSSVIKLSVTFNPNGGALTSTTSPQTILYGTSVSKPSDPFLAGSQFINWTLDINPTTGLQAYSFGSAVTSNITLYAIWNEIGTINVTFDTNGGNALTSTNPARPAYNSVLPTPSVTTKPGYEFVSWNILNSDDRVGSVWQFGSRVTQTSDFTLQAQWKVHDDPINVSVDPKGGTFADGTSAVINTTVKYSTSYTPPSNPTKVNYSFVNWFNASDVDSNGNVINNASPFSSSNLLIADTNIVAVWQSQDPVTLTFNTNGGSPAAPNQTIKYGTLATSPIVTLPGYEFVGWFAPSATQPFIFSKPVTASVALTAQWQDNKGNLISMSNPTDTSGDSDDNAIRVAVTFDLNGGQFTDNTVNPTKVLYSASVSQPSNPIMPGFRFGGWNFVSGTTNPVSTVSSQYVFSNQVLSDTTLQAVWLDKYNKPITATNPADTSLDTDGKPTESNNAIYVTVTTDLGDGTTPTTQSVLLNGTLTQPTTPTRAGYKFNGWQASINATTSAWTNWSTPIGQDMTLTAQWQAMPAITVSFNALGGSPTPSSADVVYNSLLTKPSDPTYINNGVGYQLLGWTRDSSGSTSATLFDFGQPVTDTSNFTLYAVWQQQSSIPVTINSKNSNGTNSTTTTTIPYSSVVPTQANPVIPGYVFNNWTLTDSNGNTLPINNPVTDTNGVTLTANFTQVTSPLTVTLDPNGGTFSDNTTVNKVFDVIVNTSFLKSNSIPSVSKPGYTSQWFVVNGDDSLASTPYDFSSLVTSNVTVRVVWTANNALVVSFNGNSGTLASNTNNITVTYGSTYPTDTWPSNPTRNGYTFDGWNTLQDGSGTTITSGSTVSIVNNTELFAQWTPAIITLTFDPNNGTLSGNQTTLNVTYGNKYPALLNATRTGYTFKEWNTKAGGTGTSIAQGDTVALDTITTVYAIWTPVQSTLTLNTNGGSLPSGVSTTQTVTFGTSSTLPQASLNGNTFTGWQVSNADGSTTTLKAGDTINVTTNQTATAVYTPYQFKLVLNANGGNVGSVSGGTLAFGSAYSSAVGGSLPTPTKTNNTFGGWFSTSTLASDSLVNDASVFNPNPSPANNSTITLYAKWNADMQSITVTENGSSEVIQVPVGQAFGSNLPTPTNRVGYTFKGWNTSPNGTGSPIKANTIVDATSSFGMYAIYEANAHTITLNSNGGSSVSPSTFNATFDSPIGAHFATSGNTYGPLPTPSRTGYNFVGWFDTNATSGGNDYTDGSRLFETDANMTLYARWQARTNIQVTLDPNGGTLANGTASTVNVTYDSTYGSAIPSDPTRDHYTFKGWFTAPTGGTQVTSSTRVNNALDHTLYAQWQIITYPVIFNEEGQVTSNPTQTGQVTSVPNKTVGSGHTVPTPNDPLKVGSSFVGWSTNKDAGYVPVNDSDGNVPGSPNWEPTFAIDPASSEFDFDAPITGPVTLYAIWADMIDVNVIVDVVISGVTPDRITVPYHAYVPTLPTPIKPGYEFVGWYYDPTQATPAVSRTVQESHSIDIQGLSSTITAFGQGDIKPWNFNTRVYQNITIFAQYEPKANVTITFDTGGGSHIDTQSVLYNDVISQPSNPTRSGYEFVGWYHGNNPWNFNNRVTNDLTLTAHWKRVNDSNNNNNNNNDHNNDKNHNNDNNHNNDKNHNNDNNHQPGGNIPTTGQEANHMFLAMALSVLSVLVLLKRKRIR